MSQVLARFYLTEVTRTPFYTGGETKEGTRVKLAAAQGEPFGPATPQGNIDMLIANPAAAKVFNDAPIHSEFSILITPLEKASQ
jgi:hypothetical protein